MIGIEDIVLFVFIAIVIVAILALLWYAIGYAESKMPMPMAWNIVRVVFVLLVVFLLIAVLLGLIGHPIIRVWPNQRIAAILGYIVLNGDRPMVLR